MNNVVEIALENALKTLSESTQQVLLEDALSSAVKHYEIDLNELLKAFQAGQLTREELDLELERERKLIEVEMLTWQIAAKAEIQKAVRAFLEALVEAID